jgi:hypothetical protein
MSKSNSRDKKRKGELFWNAGSTDIFERTSIKKIGISDF